MSELLRKVPVIDSTQDSSQMSAALEESYFLFINK